MCDSKYFNEYMLKEYSKIADAHFKMVETISHFFRHYFIIMTLPIGLIAYLISTSNKSILHHESINSYNYSIMLIISSIPLLVSLAGFFVMIYIINLRCDALLYARSINGMRKYFYDISELDDNIKQRIRVLPQTPQLPSYYEPIYFKPIMYVFSLFNTFYLVLFVIFINISVAIYFKFPVTIEFNTYTLVVVLLYICLHNFYYKSIAYNREYSYLKSNVIGIDIDGVLNKHREHFCSILYKITSKTINPDQITHIPVHEASIDITEEEALEVFNDPRYWIDMPCNENAQKNIYTLKNYYNMKIYLFTHRPWPKVIGLNVKDREETNNKWKEYLKNYNKKYAIDSNKNSSIFEKSMKIIVCYIIIPTTIIIRRYIMIDYVTKIWLKINEFTYDKLIIEKSHNDISIPSKEHKNRYYYSRLKNIRYFVEDDLEKAIKLSFICDYVFLMDHPYNQSEPVSNIVRVKSWDEIYRIIRKLS